MRNGADLLDEWPQLAQVKVRLLVGQHRNVDILQNIFNFIIFVTYTKAPGMELALPQLLVS